MIAADGLTEPSPFSVIVTLEALPPNILPLTVTAVVPQVLPLMLLSITAGPFIHPHDTEKLFPVALHPEAFLTAIVWLPFATPVKMVLDWYVPPSSLYSRSAPLGLVTVITALLNPCEQSTDSTGAVGVVFGAAVPLPGKLVQPFIVVVTVYVPAVFTVIPEVVAPVFHNNVPVAAVVNVDVPLQLSTTVTTGAAGVVFGAAVPLPGKLVHTFTVVVTVYVPAVFTVILEVVAPVLHK